MPSPSTVERDDTGRLWARLRGRVEIDDIDRLSDDLLPRLEKIESGGELIIDMQELDAVSTEARLRLVELQRSIANHKVRTAFVAKRPRFRGIGLFVAHTSGDPNARAFHGLVPAQAWLKATEGRDTRLTNWRDNNLQNKRPRRPGRRSSEELRLRVAKLRRSKSRDEEDPR